MRMNTLKLTGINFPLFALKRKPYKVEYTQTHIYCYTTEDSHKATVDNKNIKGDYFNRLFTMEHRINFDYTCKNIQDVIYSKVRWGIDSKAIVHDLSKLVSVPCDSKQVRKIDHNLVWLRKVSYPFKLNTNEALPNITDMYATIVNINSEWYIYEFTLDKDVSKKRILI